MKRRPVPALAAALCAAALLLPGAARAGAPPPAVDLSGIFSAPLAIAATTAGGGQSYVALSGRNDAAGGFGPSRVRTYRVDDGGQLESLESLRHGEGHVDLLAFSTDRDRPCIAYSVERAAFERSHTIACLRDQEWIELAFDAPFDTYDLVDLGRSGGRLYALLSTPESERLLGRALENAYYLFGWTGRRWFPMGDPLPQAPGPILSPLARLGERDAGSKGAPPIAVVDPIGRNRRIDVVELSTAGWRYAGLELRSGSSGPEPVGRPIAVGERIFMADSLIGARLPRPGSRRAARRFAVLATIDGAQRAIEVDRGLPANSDFVRGTLTRAGERLWASWEQQARTPRGVQARAYVVSIDPATLAVSPPRLLFRYRLRKAARLGEPTVVDLGPTRYVAYIDPVSGPRLRPLASFPLATRRQASARR